MDKQTSGRIGPPAPVLPEAPTRERYVINSLIEEAITSSQLEGAATTRKVAKEMLRTGRKPRTRDELMILNNYRGMLRVRELRHERLTPAMIAEFHRIITDGTLDDQSDCGRLQLPGEDRVVIVDYHDDEVMHALPGATQLPERLERLCQSANGDLDTGYVPRSSGRSCSTSCLPTIIRLLTATAGPRGCCSIGPCSARTIGSRSSCRSRVC